MCGILFLCQKACSESEVDDNQREFESVFENLKKLNVARGPDAHDTLKSTANDLALTFFGSELRLRGSHYISQPHRDPEGNILCWNGEVCDNANCVAENENDGANLFSLLQKSTSSEDVRNILGRIEGPYAIAFYHGSMRKLFFARDPLGRRSLLIHKPTQDNPRLLLTSVSAGAQNVYDLEELSTEYIFSLDFAVMEHSNVCATHSSELAELAKVNRTLPPADSPLVQDLDHIPEHLVAAVGNFIEHLDKSVMLRVKNIPQEPSDKGKARVAVLFSGGIDSTMLAFLASRHAEPGEPIDLLNVAFENPRKILVQAEGNIGGLPKREKKQKLKDRVDYSSIDVSYHVPDRATGLQEVEELRRLCPDRTWNFVEINVPYEESQGARQTVEALMWPGKTVMDLSLAIALYFAARGAGQIRSHPGADPHPYTTPARVLLNGLGSDELLGGYGRHRTAFKMGGWQAIIDELQLELDRIPTRNLGRDDRMISSHGRETRHPFLSLSVVKFLADLPVHLKLDPRLPPGLGEKMLLRLAARKVGLVEASSRKKRAMQFGSHSARMGPGEGDRKGDLLLGEH
ncbi:asparagine synthase-domain-containing protein [Abortiporus biennis]|nr:asparagine synthase-domain-containing protein [Abortiporus biennis]